jgi:pyrimidine oxygenase
MLGLFQPNESFAHWPTSAPTKTEWTYSYNLSVVQLAEEVGMAFAFPAARWAGLPGDEIVWRSVSLDTITLSAALLSLTTKITLLTTIHTNLFNPVVAAKLGADLDHIGHGRWGLNVVSGWGEAEFASMGVALLPHKERYRYTREWLDVIELLWESGAASLDGEYFKINNATARPRPMQRRPLVVNAGQSYTGMRFAAERANYLFSYGTRAPQFREAAAKAGSDCGFIGTKGVIIGATKSEAHQRASNMIKYADHQAVRNMWVASGAETPQSAAERLAKPHAVQDYILDDVIVGDPEYIGIELAKWASEWDVDGICLTLVDYLDDLELLGSRTIPVLGNELDSRGKSLLIS